MSVLFGYNRNHLALLIVIPVVNIKVNEGHKPKRTFEQACRECNAVSHEVFERELMRQLEIELKKRGKI